MLQIIGIKNCDTMKKTFKWLEANNFDYDFRDVKKNPLNLDEITSLAGRLGIDVLLNRRGTKWRSLELGDAELTDQQLIALLQEHQTMIKRPVVVVGDAVMVGFDESALETFLEEYL
jgi:Spx/MgsR family transcriptional regulator